MAVTATKAKIRQDVNFASALDNLIKEEQPLALSDVTPVQEENKPVHNIVEPIQSAPQDVAISPTRITVLEVDEVEVEEAPMVTNKNAEKSNRSSSRRIVQNRTQKPTSPIRNTDDAFLDIMDRGKGTSRTVYFENDVYEYLMDTTQRYNVKISKLVNLLLKEAIAYRATDKEQQ